MKRFVAIPVILLSLSLSASAEIMGGESKTIDHSALPSGEYTLSFAASGEPYTIALAL